MVDEGFIAQREGAEDRRERLLHVTAKGSRLTEELTALQVKRIEDAFANGAGCRDRDPPLLLAMIAEPINPGSKP